MVDAVGLPGLPDAGGGLHQPRGCPAAHALQRSPRTDEVRKHRPYRGPATTAAKLLLNKTQKKTFKASGQFVVLPEYRFYSEIQW